MAAPSRILLSPPDVGPLEREALLRAFDSGWIAPVGPEIGGLEEEIAIRLGGEVEVAALQSGSAALLLALRLLGVGRGDRVLVPSFTFVASANAVLQLGAEPVFLDAEESTWNLDPDGLAEALTHGGEFRAVVTVDLYGQCADYARILPLCRERGIPVVQDAAESLGAFHHGAPAGLQGDLAVFSFNGNKITTTAGGGALVSRNGEWIQRARKWATQAREPAAHYQHEEMGYNFRLSNLLAALGRAQLARLDGMIGARRDHRRAYREALADLPGVAPMPEGATGTPNYWLSCLLLDPRKAAASPEEVRQALEREDIETRPLWKPLHLQPLFAGAECRGGAVCERVFARGLCLPSGSAMTVADRNRVIASLRRVLGAPTAEPASPQA